MNTDYTNLFLAKYFISTAIETVEQVVDLIEEANKHFGEWNKFVSTGSSYIALEQTKSYLGYQLELLNALEKGAKFADEKATEGDTNDKK